MNRRVVWQVLSWLSVVALSDVRQTMLFYNDSSNLRLSGISSGPPGAASCALPTGVELQQWSYVYDAAATITTDAAKKHAVRTATGSGGSTQSITIRAKGEVFENVWPQMSLWVNGSVRQTWNVTSTVWANYTWSTALTGQDMIEVVYSNDSGARNLYVDYVVVNGVTVQTEGGAMVYDRGWGSAAFDGLDVVAPDAWGGMYWDGALRFVRGGNALAAGYDQNGNPLALARSASATSRVVDGSGYLLSYDAENRLVEVKRGATTVASFVYNADGQRIKTTFGSTTTVYIGDYYEKSGSVVKKYYYAGGRRIAVRDGGTLYYVLPDHPQSS